ncbi:MAG: tyrosine-protein phosphatase [Burkholderiales bacterium]|nr:tyrosine-protein phosphatase [Burkholderiales bacterium]
MRKTKIDSAMDELSLQGALNFRGFGDYEMNDGRRIKRGKLFRSGSLAQLTTEDIEILESLPLLHVLDYRNIHEAMQQPDKLWANAIYECIPANPSEMPGVEPARLMAYAENGEAAFSFLCDLYRRLPFENKAYWQLAQWLQASEIETIIQHCAIGKDRTGVGSAILLMILGASRATIICDYQKTDAALAVYRARMMAIWREGRSDDELQAMNCLFSADKAFIVSALDAIDERYSNTQQYLKEEFDLDADTLEDIRSRYLEFA